MMAQGREMTVGPGEMTARGHEMAVAGRPRRLSKAGPGPWRRSRVLPCG